MASENKPAQQHAHPTWRLTLWALKEVGLPTAEHTKQLSKLGAAYDAAASRMGGNSYNDARRAFHASKHDPEAALDWPTVQLRFAAKRKAVRDAMLKPSTAACTLVAEILEQAAPQMPKLAAKIDASERALVGGSGPEAKSELVRSIEALETHMKLHAKMLRDVPRMCNPANILSAV